MTAHKKIVERRTRRKGEGVEKVKGGKVIRKSRKGQRSNKRRIDKEGIDMIKKE